MPVVTDLTEGKLVAIEFFDFNFGDIGDSINFNDLSPMKTSISRTLGQQ